MAFERREIRAVYNRTTASIRKGPEQSLKEGKGTKRRQLPVLSFSACARVKRKNEKNNNKKLCLGGHCRKRKAKKSYVQLKKKRTDQYVRDRPWITPSTVSLAFVYSEWNSRLDDSRRR